jgi:uncharacterized protein
MEVRMTRIITYSLRQAEQDSSKYYRDIAAFVDTWLGGAVSEANDLITGFREFRLSRGEADRSDAEYAFELLVLGVLWREHGAEAAVLPNWTVHALERLQKAQRKWPRSEKFIKSLRGWVGWMARRTGKAGPDCYTVDRLVVWLQAIGENGRAGRLAQWQNYLESGEAPAESEIVSLCLRLAQAFALASQSTLGKYTSGVDRFLSETAPRYRRRYDAALIFRSRVEYHLGMLGTEILNRSYRQRFLATTHKVVILPPCMRAQVDADCKAVSTPYGSKCLFCTPACRVYQVTKLGEKRGFNVYMVPDEMRVFGSGEGKVSPGVVGVSCALTNWGGGWDTNELGIPAQGVLLDYVGCKYHWDEQGIPTDTNLEKLFDVLNLENR